MTTAPARVGEIRFNGESAAGETIATPSSYWSGKKKVYAWDVAPLVGKLSEEDPSLRTNLFESPPNILTGKQASLGFKCHLHGLAQTASAGVAITQDDLGYLLKAALGGQHLGTTTSVDPTNTGLGATSALKCLNTGGLYAGGAVYVVATNECRRIVSVSSPNITLDMDLSSAPTSGLVIAAETTYPDDAALADLSDAAHVTVAALFRGYHTEDQWQVRGGAVEVELANLGAPKPGQLQFAINGMDGELVSGVVVGSPFTQQAPAPQINAGFYYTTVGTTRRYLDTKSIDIKLGIKREAYPSPAAQQGIAGHGYMGGRTTVEFEAPYDAAYHDDYEAMTAIIAGYQFGRVSATLGPIFISLPVLYHDKDPERVGGQSFTGSKCTMHADNSATTTSDLTLARFAIHRFPHT